MAKRRRLSPRKPSTYDNAKHSFACDYEQAERHVELAKENDPEGRWEPPEAKDLPADILLARLSGVRPSGDGWAAQCPAHPDNDPSLSITELDNRDLLVCCHAGCTAYEVMAAVGLDLSHLYCSNYARRHGTPDPVVRGGGGKYQGLERVIEHRDHGYVDWTFYIRWAEVDDNHCRQLEEVPVALGDSTELDGMSFLARKLGVPVHALEAIGCRWNPDGVRPRWLIPEYDGRGVVSGLVHRYEDGAKKALPGSKRGLTLACGGYSYGVHDRGELHVTEGASDAACLIGLGLWAVGRSNALEAVADLELLLRGLWAGRAETVVVWADNDKPGIFGATSTAEWLRDCLHLPVRVGRVPKGFKDVRECFGRCGNAAWSQSER